MHLILLIFRFLLVFLLYELWHRQLLAANVPGNLCRWLVFFSFFLFCYTYFFLIFFFSVRFIPPPLTQNEILFFGEVVKTTP